MQHVPQGQCAAASLVVRGAGQVDGVLVHEVARPRIAASASAVGITGTFDPQVGVGMRTRGSCRGRDAERPAAGIAPIERAVWRRSGAVARGVDHVVRAFCERRNRFAVTDFLIGGEEIGGVEAEAPGVCLSPTWLSLLAISSAFNHRECPPSMYTAAAGSRVRVSTA